MQNVDERWNFIMLHEHRNSNTAGEQLLLKVCILKHYIFVYLEFQRVIAVAKYTLVSIFNKKKNLCKVSWGWVYYGISFYLALLIFRNLSTLFTWPFSIEIWKVNFRHFVRTVKYKGSQCWNLAIYIFEFQSTISYREWISAQNGDTF